MGRSRSAIGIRANQAASGPPDVQRWVLRDSDLEIGHCGPDHDFGIAQAKRGPTVVELLGGVAGLLKTSFALCHQLTTLDRAKLTRRLGAVSSEVLLKIEEGLKAAMDLD